MMAVSKKEKQKRKHSAFKSRIEKRYATGPSQRRRRPSKKLVANLESLAAALPDLEGDIGATGSSGQARIAFKSLQSGPGSLRKKATIERAEKDRFQKTMAELATSHVPRSEDPEGGLPQRDVKKASSTSDRWAILRNYISSSIEQKSDLGRSDSTGDHQLARQKQ
ncbi:MAG: hypothetical protein M1816_007353 [Peltula sp. TS41687]|nr:MAG: hypothetical protein M1816_007353 [Peltula sp. TS41687]